MLSTESEVVNFKMIFRRNLEVFSNLCHWLNASWHGPLLSEHPLGYAPHSRSNAFASS
jgi:hypothetical protein